MISNQQKLEIAIEFVKAQKAQAKISEAFDAFSKAMFQDNPFISVGNTEMEVLNDKLLRLVLGEEVAEWLFWYVLDADYGNQCTVYHLNGHRYDLKDQSFPEFFNNILYFYDESE